MSDVVPIVYDGFVDVRFNDLDPYNHVNSGVYLEYVISTRWRFTLKEFGTSPDDFLKRGLAFYARQATVRFRRPITGLQTLYVASHVAEVKRSDIRVDFQIKNESKETLFADGSFEFVAMDAASRRPVELPEWVSRYFFR